MIPAIVLAAGKSTRMGRSKALLPLGPGDTFLTRIVRTLSDAAVEDVVVVAGPEAEAVLAALDGTSLTARFVVNSDYESGQLSSLLAGLRVVARPGVVATLITLVDLPLVTTGTVRAVIDRYRQTGAPVVRPVQGRRHGHPVLVERSLFDALRAADLASGAKSVIRDHVSSSGEVEVADEGAFRDIDTPAEYDRLMIELGVTSGVDLPRDPAQGGRP